MEYYITGETMQTLDIRLEAGGGGFTPAGGVGGGTGGVGTATAHPGGVV